MRYLAKGSALPCSIVLGSEMHNMINEISIPADAVHSFRAVQNGLSLCNIGIFSLITVKNITPFKGCAFLSQLAEPSLNGQTNLRCASLYL